jgi:hypothetical protein
VLSQKPVTMLAKLHLSFDITKQSGTWNKSSSLL